MIEHANPLMILATFVVLLLANDAWFYMWHRLLHHPKLFRHVHAVHHESVDVNCRGGCCACRSSAG